MSRSDVIDDSYSINATTTYRFAPEWSAQFGVEYSDFGSTFGGFRSDGFGATFALIWQPRYDRRAEALRVTRHGFTLPGSDSALAVTVTAPRAEIDASLARLRRPLACSWAIQSI